MKPKKKKRTNYERLEATCEKIPKHETLTIAGDLNAKIGKKEYLKGVAGKETIPSTTTDNEKRIINLHNRDNRRNKNRRKNEWFDEKCEKLIKEKKEARAKWLKTNKEKKEQK
ncbi:hypothetical protein ILUMI_21295 [Ignelater luminosus]|uniref:Uncharacterized protein n=1 Tax=Ignelater luminosus TaxID=2038154 RepID=A0A8K0CGQ5_IGNLU|nr:hypothetical protein ILUMI_21295 [Ignelater luminosus]